MLTRAQSPKSNGLVHVHRDLAPSPSLSPHVPHSCFRVENELASCRDLGIEASKQIHHLKLKTCLRCTMWVISAGKTFFAVSIKLRNTLSSFLVANTPTARSVVEFLAVSGAGWECCTALRTEAAFARWGRGIGSVHGGRVLVQGRENHGLFGMQRALHCRTQKEMQRTHRGGEVEARRGAPCTHQRMWKLRCAREPMDSSRFGKVSRA